MELLQIVSISCMVMIFSLVIKRDRPELALLLSMALAAMIFFIMLGKLKIVWDLFKEWQNEPIFTRYIYKFY